MSGRLLVVGSVNHDLVVAVERLPAPGETVLGAELVERDGGKGANAAAAAARLGASVVMVGATGADARGDGARAALAEAGVDVALVARLDHAPTGVAVVAVDSAGETRQSRPRCAARTSAACAACSTRRRRAPRCSSSRRGRRC
jgi:ribokinase